ncbi:hypothetical protein F5Y08DRAFT_338301 [Xylaria arbuscula]|nr:hypothetical protein F5Y08DRAFT_338301 [Xylaria arbuscula]
MDPLSVTAAVAGIIKAALEVVKLLRPYASAVQRTPSVAAHVSNEIEGTRTILIGLQTLAQETSGEDSRGGALISINQIVVILTGGVLLFAELEGAVRGLVEPPSFPPSGYLDGRRLPLTQRRLKLTERMHWAHREESLKPLLARLQGFKVSVTAVLTLLQCDSDRRAEQLQLDLAANVQALLDNNRELSERMMRLEDSVDRSTIRRRMSQAVGMTPALGRTENLDLGVSKGTLSMRLLTQNTSSSPYPVVQSVFEFERDLQLSSVYRRVRRGSMDFSFHSSIARTNAWSLLSDYSLADLSVLSVIALPLDLSEVTNSHCYIEIPHQQLASVVDEDLCLPTPAPSLLEKPSLLRECVRLYLQLVQIPSFSELFIWEKQVQQVENGLDASVLGEGEGGSGEWIWQLDLFAALKSIFQKETTHQLLIDEINRISHLEPLETSDLRSDLRSKSPNNISIFRVLTYVSMIIGYLEDGRSIDIPYDDVLDKLLCRENLWSLLPTETYEPAITKLVEALRVSVQDLLPLTMATDMLADSNREELSRGYYLGTSLSSYASSQIDLLLTLERVLWAPWCHHLKDDIIRQWCVTAEAHYKLAILNGLGTSYDYLGAKVRGSVQIDSVFDTAEAQEIIKGDLEFTFPLIAELFQDVVCFFLDGRGETVDWRRQCLRVINDTILTMQNWLEQVEARHPCKTLFKNGQDRQNWRYFGHLILANKLRVQVDGGPDDMVYVCLFERALFFLEEDDLRGFELRLSHLKQPITKAETSNKFQWKNLVYLSDVVYHIYTYRDGPYYDARGRYCFQFLHKRDRTIIEYSINFVTEWQMVQWGDAFKRLTRSSSQPIELWYDADEMGVDQGVGDDHFIICEVATRLVLKKDIEKCEWITVLKYISADGHALPLLVVLKGKDVQHQWFPRRKLGL